MNKEKTIQKAVECIRNTFTKHLFASQILYMDDYIKDFKQAMEE